MVDTGRLAGDAVHRVLMADQGECRWAGMLGLLGDVVDRDQALELALRRDNVRRHLDGRRPREVVYVPDRLINLVTRGR